ncbi:hypothetical protein GCM10010313_54400 [Streptomyces violarus]|uniref:Uncharacterized protein n=1 Tax=Streptomyces violarus TaxID=67380 RepID=A0A7W4ZV90_9ACTN|nr:MULTISPECIES: hypothetical protein [Streptomyces]MBB3079183.1 hypothetical protein [Streptomyces violarus]WRU01733.1 hypothetical protein VJ737_30475 [Streptomyces sp. CGMCC 4.1772]GHD21137.1 hypothetical protein GCM10010313_54400 [Streptomyces violarus]
MNSGRTKNPHTWIAATRGPRGPWAVLCAVASVVLGPAAATASALDQANAAPLYDAVKSDTRSLAVSP